MKYFDLHCDTATEMFDTRHFSEPRGHINAPALSSFEHAVQCFAVFIDDKRTDRGMDYFRSVVDNLHKEIKNVKNLTPVITTEGGNVIEGKIENLDLLADAGVKIFGFVWNGSNTLACGALCNNEKGLTSFGKDVAKRLKELGVYPDVSHLSDAGFYDLAKVYDGPIIATHSNARSVCNHLRNLTDDELKLIFERNGLAGLNLYVKTLSADPSIEDLIRHAEKMLSLGGEKSICLGCDLDGIINLPKGLKDVSGIADIYAMFEKEFGTNVADEIVWKNASEFFKVNI